MHLRAAIVVASLSLAACSGLKEALTSHVNVAARAGSNELTSERLAELMTSGKMPPRKDLAVAVASLWVNYQLLAQAAGRADTLGDPEVAMDAMWAQVAQRKLAKLQEKRMQTAGPATSAADLEKAYEAGELLVVRHILVTADQPEKVEAAKRKADDIRRRATPANFVALVKQHSEDPGSKDAGGEYLWPTPQIQQMVPEFEQMSRTMKPGTISDPVKTQYGFHIIYREPYSEAKAKFDSAYIGVAAQKAESVWTTGVEAAANVKVKEGVGPTVKAMAENLDAYRTNRKVLATSNKVDLRAARVAHWIAAFPPQMRIRQQLGQLPDSIIPQFLRSLMRNELLLIAADSAKLGLDSAETRQLHEAFRQSVNNTMGALGILPQQLADSGGAGQNRSTLAMSRVDAYFERLLKNQAQFIDVSEPVAIALRSKYEGNIAESGIDRAVTMATEMKAKADSVEAASMPPSAVPMPGATTPAPTPAPTPAAPPATKKQP
jgi:hypothetical protein